MSGENGAREVAKQATRQALVEAAAAEFFTKGFDVPSLDTICARAGYTRGAFYVHFRSRDELIGAAMESALRGLLDAVIATDARDLEATIRRFVAIAVRPVGETSALAGPPFHQVLEACRRSELVRATFVGILGEAIDRLTRAADAGPPGRRSDLRGDEMARVLVMLALGARTAQEVGLPMDIDATQDAAIRLLLGNG